jgi:hypothetical protein
MYRPEVKIVEPQIESSIQPNISDWESNQLLLKYGYISSQNPPQHFDPTRDLSYQELMELEDKKIFQKTIPNPKIESFSIDPNSVRHFDNKVSSEDGFSLEIRIVSDMKI